MGNNLERMKIPWHPGFYGAMEIELITDKQVFAFQREYNLSKEPIRMDLLIIRENCSGSLWGRTLRLRRHSPVSTM